jgi:GntR family transcriptional regulator
MLSSRLDASDSTPLWQQVAAEIRRSITDGEIEPGERMPLARDLATVLGVNRNTILRALHELRDEGLLEMRQGRGITVAGTPERGAVLTRARDLIAFARKQGYRPDEVIEMIQAFV